jgi:hypothetical protein
MRFGRALDPEARQRQFVDLIRRLQSVLAARIDRLRQPRVLASLPEQKRAFMIPHMLT